jgi:hypothetical protein
MDFTLKTYKTLLNTLISEGYKFQTFQEFMNKPKEKAIVLRHDVDKLPENSLRFAQIQYELGIKGSYYFRIVPESFKTKIIEEIAKLGHEIGYHYEDIDLAVKSMKNEKLTINKDKEIANKAIELFEKHLYQLRKYYPVKTICMHGSPLSKYDNKLLWKYYDYKDFGIIGEPYFDVDFSKVLYLTDTGRRWDGDRVSIRDKVSNSNDQSPMTNHQFAKTKDIIQAIEKGRLLSGVEGPNRIMFTFHPQRWTDKPIDWTKELVWQNTKNVVKYFLNKIRS